MSVCTTQPLTAAKNASNVFCDYIAAVEAADQVGLSIYTHTNTDGAYLESGLTHDVASVKPLYRNRQAGHYDTLTNIGGGLKVAREELENNGRQDAYRVIVLMTDGIANRPSGTAEQWAINQANLCKTARIKIMAVALGLGADEDLMLQMAEITGQTIYRPWRGNHRRIRSSADAGISGYRSRPTAQAASDELLIQPRAIGFGGNVRSAIGRGI